MPAGVQMMMGMLKAPGCDDGVVADRAAAAPACTVMASSSPRAIWRACFVSQCVIVKARSVTVAAIFRRMSVTHTVKS